MYFFIESASLPPHTREPGAVLPSYVGHGLGVAVGEGVGVTLGVGLGVALGRGVADAKGVAAGVTVAKSLYVL